MSMVTVKKHIAAAHEGLRPDRDPLVVGDFSSTGVAAPQGRPIARSTAARNAVGSIAGYR